MLVEESLLTTGEGAGQHVVWYTKHFSAEFDGAHKKSSVVCFLAIFTAYTKIVLKQPSVTV